MELLAEGFGGRAEEVFGDRLAIQASSGRHGAMPTIAQIAEVLLRAERAQPKPTEKNPLYPQLAMHGIPPRHIGTVNGTVVSPPATPGAGGLSSAGGWAGLDPQLGKSLGHSSRVGPGQHPDTPQQSDEAPAVPTPSASPAKLSRWHPYAGIMGKLEMSLSNEAESCRMLGLGMLSALVVVRKTLQSALYQSLP